MSIFLISAFILCFRVWNHVLPEWLELVEQSCALFGRGKHNNEKSSDFWSVVLFKEARWGRSQSQEWSEPIVLAIWASVWQIQGQDLQMALGYMAYNVNSMWSKTATSSPLVCFCSLDSWKVRYKVLSFMVTIFIRVIWMKMKMCYNWGQTLCLKGPFWCFTNFKKQKWSFPSQPPHNNECCNSS